MKEFIESIKHQAKDIKRQIAAVSKANKSLNIQLDESTDVDKDAQCMVYVR
jgi:DNA-binding FrmR family transcriptional regulator